MGEEFYSIIKLISGEEIFALISIDHDQEDPIVILQNPLVMKMINSPKGSYIKVNRWIELSSDDIFMMRLDRILTMTESRDAKLIAIYDNFIEDNEDERTVDVSLERRGDPPVLHGRRCRPPAGNFEQGQGKENT